MNDLTRRGLIFGAAGLLTVGIFRGLDRVASSSLLSPEEPEDPNATVEIAQFDETGKRTGTVRLGKVHKSPDEWRRTLTAPQFAVTRQAGTEIPGSGELLHENRAGI